MNKTLTSVRSNLETIISQLQAVIPSEQSFGIAHGNWTFPGLTKAELVQEAKEIIDLIDQKKVDDLGEYDAIISDYNQRLQFLNQNTLPNIWGNAAQGVATYLMTMAGLRKKMSEALGDGYAGVAKRARELTDQLRRMETRLAALEPRTVSLAGMVERIEQAYEAADNLPADLKDLEEARAKIAQLSGEAQKDQTRLLDMKTNAEEIDKFLQEKATEAQAVLERTERAYSGATSLALASAFSSRANDLGRSMWYWVGGLVISLVAGGWLGSNRLHDLITVFEKPDASAALVVANVLLAVLAVGAPIWFAWLSTKQIGQRFRLAEDYAFKASISQAYDGFRRETVRVDKALEHKLLQSALSRFDEQPLRLIETATHGSPWHELASSEAMKKAVKTVPDAVEAVTDAAKKVAAKVAPTAEN